MEPPHSDKKPVHQTSGYLPAAQHAPANTRALTQEQKAGRHVSSAVLHNWHLSVCDNFLIQIRNAVHAEEHLPPSASLWFLQLHGAAEQYRLEQPGVSPKASS